MTTTVVNVKVTNIRPQYKNLKEWIEDSENNVYIGRAGVVFIDGQRYPKQASLWANPYKIGQYTRDECLAKYETYFLDRLKNDPSLVEELLKLKGKRLGCWCSPEKCHGDVLIKLISQF